MKNNTLNIPSNILDDIQNRWFHLYEWISSEEIKISIERDFLKMIKKYWLIISIFFVVPVAFWFLVSNFAGFIILGISFLILNIIFSVYLFFLSISRTKILKNNSFVILTDNYISIDWDIFKFEELKKENIENIYKIWEIFEEKLFEKSKINESKAGLKKIVFQDLASGYKKIFEMWGKNISRSRDSGKIILLLWALYTLYLASIFFVYIIWIFLIWWFWKFINFVNKKILLIYGHKITKINYQFEEIDKNSKKILDEKNTLEKYFSDSLDNKWQDSLLLKINESIKFINNIADDSINISVELKKDIKASKYNSMFNYEIFNNWLKKEIKYPLEQLKKLLEKNLERIQDEKQSTNEQIAKTKDQKNIWALVSSQKRVEMRIEEIKKHIESIDFYIKKLD